MPGRVLTIHGIAAGVDPQHFCFRNMSDPDAMDRYLASAPPFVPLTDALAGRGDALAIDDAVRGAGDAALLARRYGHAVSLFVNPGQVESGAPYAFNVLNALLDGLGNFDGRRRVFEGTVFGTSTVADRQTLRSKIKTRLCTITDERERLGYIEGLAAEWRVAHLDVPRHFQTLSRQDLAALRDVGVDLQNHGWSHTDHASLSSTDSAREVREGRAWLFQELGVEAAYFAVPFGEALPQPGSASSCDIWFVLTEGRPAGPVSPNVFNREAPQGALARQLRGSVAHFAGRLRE